MKISERILKDMILRRRDFHKYPETGWSEFRTTAKIAEIIGVLGYDMQFCGDRIKPEDVMGRTVDPEAEMKRAIEQGADEELIVKMKGYTGLIAELDMGIPGPVTVFRFDIDCVDTNETEDDGHPPVKGNFRSCSPGRMHACGHDGHIAIGLALAEVLINENYLKGKIRLLFQPAEEGARGAYAMTMSGIVDDADYFIAPHIGLGSPTGTVYGGTKGFLCSTKFDADFKGIGAHAGGEPNKGRNALLAAASAVLSLHSIAPHADGITRINVGVLNAGEGRNVVPPNAHMKIETRGATAESEAYVYERAIQILHGAADMYGVSLAITKRGETITAESDLELADIVIGAARSVEGVKNYEGIQSMLGSDDACWMMKRVQERGGKATYISIGADTLAGHHNDHFDFDESALQIGLEVLYNTVLKLNGI